MDSIFRTLQEPEILAFYGWWQFVACLFAFAGLMAIWWHIGRKQKEVGQVWLALSVLCWSASGAIEIYYAKQSAAEAATVQAEIATQLQGKQSTEWQGTLATYEADRETMHHRRSGWRSILSLLNSLFILLSLSQFRYIPSLIQPLLTSRLWIAVVGLPFFVSLLQTIRKMFGEIDGWVSELDVYYAIITLVFLGWVLWESFAKRRLMMLAWLSGFCILITLAAQIFKLPAFNVDPNLLSAIFKTSLIMLFFALALSWVKELSENVIPGPEFLSMRFDRKKDEAGKYQHRVVMKGFAGQKTHTVVLTRALYDLLHKFAERKKEDTEGWLEIKPKSDPYPEKNYDIKDHNELKRLLTALLDQLFGEGNWTKNQHEQPLRQALFELSEKRDRRIRLRVPSGNITL